MIVLMSPVIFVLLFDTCGMYVTDLNVNMWILICVYVYVFFICVRDPRLPASLSLYACTL